MSRDAGGRPPFGRGGCQFVARPRHENAGHVHYRSCRWNPPLCGPHVPCGPEGERLSQASESSMWCVPESARLIIHSFIYPFRLYSCSCAYEMGMYVCSRYFRTARHDSCKRTRGTWPECVEVPRDLAAQRKTRHSAHPTPRHFVSHTDKKITTEKLHPFATLFWGRI